MASACNAPALREELLSSERMAALSPVLRAHVEACAACRLTHELLQEAANTWASHDWALHEHATGYARFEHARRRAHGRWKLAFRAAPGALLLAAAAAFAASHGVFRPEPRRVNHDVVLPPPTAPKPDLPRALPAAPQVSPAASAVPPAPPKAPRRPEPVAAAPAPPFASENASATNAWAAAAAAMRAHDYANAERAFDELSQSADARTRDAGRLSRAQLWRARGQGARARAEFESLAQTGATSVIRERAAQSLKDVP